MASSSRNAIRLLRPCDQYREQFRVMAAEFHAAGEPDWPHGAWSGDRLAQDDFDAYLQRCLACEAGRDLPPDRVPDTTFWIVREEPEGGPAGLLGTLNLRHRLNPYLEHEGGHVGYCIRPAARGRGYATQALRLACIEARLLGLNRVLVTCDETNHASAAVIRKCGGVLEDQRISRRHAGLLVQRFWIAL